MSKAEFSTGRQYKRNPDRLSTITEHIARCMGEIIRFPHTHTSALIELGESLDDYARYIIASSRDPERQS